MNVVTVMVRLNERKGCPLRRASGSTADTMRRRRRWERTRQARAFPSNGVEVLVNVRASCDDALDKDRMGWYFLLSSLFFAGCPSFAEGGGLVGCSSRVASPAIPSFAAAPRPSHADWRQLACAGDQNTPLWRRRTASGSASNECDSFQRQRGDAERRGKERERRW